MAATKATTQGCKVTEAYEKTEGGLATRNEVLANGELRRPRRSGRELSIAKLHGLNDGISCHNLDNTKPEDVKAAVLSVCGTSEKLWNVAPVQVKARYIICRPAEQFNKDSGEIESRIRSTIIDNAGKVYTTNSGPVSDVCLLLLGTPAGVKAFDPPLPMAFSKEGTLSGGSILKCVVEPKEIDRLM